MKYVVLVGDGMADRKLKELGGMTPLEKAFTPNMDKLAREGIPGMVRTVPEGFHPGSDVANLSILGYNPAQYYTGRAPLEAASMGVGLGKDDVAFRCNLVTLKFNKDVTKAQMDDYSSGHITTPEAKHLIEDIDKEIGSDNFRFYPGISYRHLAVWKNGEAGADCTPPHDILGKEITDYLPIGDGADILRDLMLKSVDILLRHEVNRERIQNGKKPANSIWLWGQGKKPALPSFTDKYSIKGALVSAVDLTKGLGICSGLEPLKVPGVTGYIDTNYVGKAEYSLKALETVDMVYIHVEAPDEAGHSGNLKDKIKAIEDFDALVVGTVLRGMKAFKDYRILLMPDHPTPIELRTHTEDPVPFAVYDSRHKNCHNVGFNEEIANYDGATKIEDGYKLMDYLIKSGLPGEKI